MKNKDIEKLKKLKIKLLTYATIVGLTSSMGGCNKIKNEDSNSEVGYLIESNENFYESDKAGLYSYLINTNGFESSNHDFSNTKTKLRYAQVAAEETYNNSSSNFDSDYIKDNFKLIWPSSYANYDEDEFNLTNTDFSLEIEQLKDLSGTSYKVIYSSLEITKDLIPSNQLNNTAKTLLEGDNFSSTAIYYNDDLIAYKQTGSGSNDENVANATRGDVDTAISTLKELDMLEETTKVTYQELESQEEIINEEKNLVKRK